MIGAYKGYKVKLCLPRNASAERKHMLHAYGAEMVFSDPAEVQRWLARMPLRKEAVSA